MMAESVTVSVLFPFVPFMVRDFYVADTDEQVRTAHCLTYPFSISMELMINSLSRD
jgi:hypothetical protein